MDPEALDLSNKTFPLDTDIINLFHFIGGIWFKNN